MQSAQKKREYPPCLRPVTTPDELPRRSRETPKSERSELRGYDGTERRSGNKRPRTEPYKKRIVAAAEPVFLSPLVDRLTGFGHVSAFTMIQHLFTSYGAMHEIDLEENEAKIMGPYDPS